MLITLREAAEQLRVSERTIRREIGSGRLQALRVRGLMRIDQADLDAYLSQSRIQQAPPCPSESAASVIRSECVLAVDSALSGRFRPAPVGPMRGRSKMRSGAATSTRRLAAVQTD